LPSALHAGESAFPLPVRLLTLPAHDSAPPANAVNEALETEILAAISEQRRPEWPADPAFEVDLRGLAERHACPGWGAHAETLGLLSALIRELRPRRVLEFGSGLSTLVMAATLKKLDAGSLLSVDESERFAARTRGWLAEEALTSQAEVWQCPIRLQTVYGSDVRCYELGSVLGDVVDVALLFVDGPNSLPLIGHPGARFGTLPLVREHLAPGAWILLDDARRRSERRVADRWSAMEGIEAIGALPTGRGLMLLRNR